jgi:hypothetical protein
LERAEQHERALNNDEDYINPQSIHQYYKKSQQVDNIDWEGPAKTPSSTTITTLP